MPDNIVKIIGPDGREYGIGGGGAEAGLAAIREALNLKLDKAAYEADEPARIKAFVLFNSSGAILKSRGVAAVAAMGSARYDITFLNPAADINYGVLVQETNGNVSPVACEALGRYKTVNGFTVQFLYNSGSIPVVNTPFVIVV